MIDLKRLNRIRLKNWHFFRDEILVIKGHSMKEQGDKLGSVLDAIQLLNLTDIGEFNRVAKKNGSYSVIDYVRCKYIDENQEIGYERNGDIISYILLEYKEQYSLTLGLKIKYERSSNSVETFWFSEEVTMENIEMDRSIVHMKKEGNMETKNIEFIKDNIDAKINFTEKLIKNERNHALIKIKRLSPNTVYEKNIVDKIVLQEKENNLNIVKNSLEIVEEIRDVVETSEEIILEVNGYIKKLNNESNLSKNILLKYASKENILEVEKVLRLRIDALENHILELEKEIEELERLTTKLTSIYMIMNMAKDYIMIYGNAYSSIFNRYMSKRNNIEMKLIEEELMQHIENYDPNKVKISELIEKLKGRKIELEKEIEELEKEKNSVEDDLKKDFLKKIE